MCIIVNIFMSVVKKKAVWPANIHSVLIYFELPHRGVASFQLFQNTYIIQSTESYTPWCNTFTHSSSLVLLMILWSMILLLSYHFLLMELMSAWSENYIPVCVCDFCVCTSVAERVCLLVFILHEADVESLQFSSRSVSVWGPRASKYVRPSGHLSVCLDRWSTWGPNAD